MRWADSAEISKEHFEWLFLLLALPLLLLLLALLPVLFFAVAALIWPPNTCDLKSYRWFHQDLYQPREVQGLC